MPERIVDLFESIQLDKKQGHAIVIAIRYFHCVINAIW